MTTRLKRKLGDLGVDTTSSKANESFCLIGTPLPPLEKSKDTGEFVPLWKQEVRDEKGRRRLHGAFTGGFSAGFFNTVGSKEGWTPATFVSSRNDRAKKKVARPEDFMDEEDLRELQESRKLVDTTEEMDLTGGTQAELRRRGAEDETEKDAITMALETAILPPAKDSAGARILRKMGWKLGQGIGPRITLRQRRLQDLQAATGRMLTGDDLRLPAEDDEEANKHTYAPRDTPVLLVDRKDNLHGLGYRPGMSLNESLGKGSASTSSGPKISAGFGLGALNDADEDDLDVYDMGSMQRNRMAYDISEGDSEDRILIGSRNERTKGPSSITATVTETFRDGTLVLSGFVLYDKPVAEDRWFPLPDVPKGWKPDPKKVWAQNGSDKENNQKETGPVPHHKWKSGMSADERGTLLGETPLPSAPKSVFDYMSQKDRERLKNIAANLASGNVPGPSATPATPSIRIPHTEPHVASAALRGFQPFTTDPAKQARYTAYLQSQADPTSQLTLAQLPNQSNEEYNKELEEYAKSAQIFKPMSGAMAGRFTSAVVVEHGPKIHEGLHQPSVEEQKAQAEREEKQREEEKLSPKEHAANLGMYGPLTREVKPWQPARLLCKRFGVKDPNPDMLYGDDCDSVPTGQQRGAPSEAADSSSASATGLSQEQIAAATASMWDTSGRGGGGASAGKRDLANVGLGEDDTQGRDTLTYERPSVDVFKAIFASDDEDSDLEGGGDHDVEDDHAVPEPTVTGLGNDGVKDTRSDPQPAKVNESIDISTFKPTFVPREARATKGSEPEDKKKKKKKDKEKRKVIVSFAMDEGGGDDGEGGGDALDIRPKKKKKNRDSKEKDRDRDKDVDRHGSKDKDKKRQKAQPVEDDDDDMWVEKPTPAGIQAQDLDVSMAPESASSGPSRVRKRAIDFM